ncbi:tryptophan synthase subunit beta [Candidatus Gottesmanbacteria bacterium RIFCSPHIGHO2_02_FULL_39_14]|uniref:Tryptophan synthase beta chain n=2 Tax=Candidatus Gottesmaniibacteriota TaxID=1752720 RepID=A0A1F6A321_9BACT|nr:MAG: tryptophan synthase subunit beta [Candidatus Gottesmanbacteria bacterium RIFCSPHIGHO2_02_FULL_39_14]OGG30862.1 MAG: tryptophan synthase subunit beta [Candidatus Gottesmanbacteria bacterium RIFCSPLOWO2_02_FULL_38_8]
MRKIDTKVKNGYFGKFGGQFVTELLYSALEELGEVFTKIKEDREFLKTYISLVEDYAGRPTPLYSAENISRIVGSRVYFKREDLLNGGSHKLNNSLGQALMVKFLGKKEIVTETAAGMNGVATAMAATVAGLKCKVFMGVKDIERQRLNADKIKLLGAEVVPVERGFGVLKDAVSEALVYWIRNLTTCHYLIGSTVGPHPFPSIVAFFQKIIGDEARRQIFEKEGKLPSHIIACGSGGSNAMGIFQAFIDDPVELIFVEGAESAALTKGTVGIFQGTKTYVLQDEFGMDRKTESRAAGLNYPGRSPQIAYLYSIRRIKAETATDQEVIEAFYKTTKLEGLMPAFETCHAMAYLFRSKGKFRKKDIVLLNFSGRGDKDMAAALQGRKFIKFIKL